MMSDGREAPIMAGCEDVRLWCSWVLLGEGPKPTSGRCFDVEHVVAAVVSVEMIPRVRTIFSGLIELSDW